MLMQESAIHESMNQHLPKDKSYLTLELNKLIDI